MRSSNWRASGSATPRPLRIGKAPKRLLVYRTAAPFKGIKRHPLEVLCLGQQFVAYAVHPETGRALCLARGGFGRPRHRQPSGHHGGAGSEPSSRRQRHFCRRNCSRKASASRLPQRE